MYSIISGLSTIEYFIHNLLPIFFADWSFVIITKSFFQALVLRIFKEV
ncbi:MAG: hypothetical protein LBQ24_00730 [Candidatus Peribacteria bacterium]|nr:hypothetical protein [Candidatus Peribacteria bacterium]